MIVVQQRRVYRLMLLIPLVDAQFGLMGLLAIAVATDAVTGASR